MLSVVDIENAITGLSKEEKNNIRDWFMKKDIYEWDNEIREDQKSGKLDKLISNALLDYNSGKTTRL